MIDLEELEFRTSLGERGAKLCYERFQKSLRRLRLGARTFRILNPFFFNDIFLVLGGGGWERWKGDHEER